MLSFRKCWRYYSKTQYYHWLRKPCARPARPNFFLPHVRTISAPVFKLSPFFRRRNILRGMEIPPPKSAETSEELPCVKCAYSQEFEPISRYQQQRQAMENYLRVVDISLRKVFGTSNTWVVVGSTFVVLGLAICEAVLMCQNPLGQIPFILKYGYKNILSSMVASSTPAELIMRSMNIDPQVALRAFSSSVDISTQLTILSISHLRGAFFGGLMTYQLLRIAQVALSSGDTYRKQILNGSASMLTGVKERVVRLSGKESSVTALSLRRYGQHIVPIFEDPNTVVHITKRHWNGGKVPVIWVVPGQQYGDIDTWNSFSLSADWLLNSVTGKKVLYLEADATNSEDTLSLGEDSYLSATDVIKGFRTLERCVRLSTVHCDKVVKVCLADSLQPILTGGGYEYTLRNHIEEMEHIDILVDKSAPILSAVLSSLKTINNAEQPRPLDEHNETPESADTMKQSTDKNRTVVFQTTNRNHFDAIKGVLMEKGYKVVDRGEKDMYDAYTCARIVCEQTTQDTVASVEALLTKQLIDPAKLCIVIDHIDGVDEIKEIEKRFKLQEPLEYICTAAIYDDLLREIRIWTRWEFSPAQIQYELDRRNREVLDAILNSRS